MSRVPINTIISLSRRSYATVTAEASGAPAAAAAMVARAAAVAGEPGAVKEKVFWMRDPKTGNWMPENRFGDVDVAELRARLLNHNDRK